MERVEVLFFNFGSENNVRVAIDKEIIYIIRLEKEIKNIRKISNRYNFSYIFIKITDNYDEDLEIFEHIKGIFRSSKIIAVSAKSDFKNAYISSKNGMDFQGGSVDLFDLFEYLRFCNEEDLSVKVFSYIKNKYLKSGRKKAFRKFSRLLTDTITVCIARAYEEYEGIGEHLEGVGQFSRFIAEKLRETQKYEKKIDDEFVECIYFAGKLHDIGKINIPKEIVNKPHILTKKECAIMKTHIYHGSEMLSRIETGIDSGFFKFFKIIKKTILYHHENYDGSGYPEGLKGENIPLSARICALADFYSALTIDRPYRIAFGYDDIIDEIGKHASKFDPDILKVFNKHSGDFKEISEVLKNNCFEYTRQCAWCKSLFIADKWLPFNELKPSSTHGICPDCRRSWRKRAR